MSGELKKRGGDRRGGADLKRNINSPRGDHPSGGGFSPGRGNRGGFSPRRGNRGGFSPRGGHRFGFSPRGGNRGGFSPRGGDRGGFSQRRGGRGELSGRGGGRGSFRKDGSREGRSGWVDRGKGNVSRATQGTKRFFENDDGMDVKKRMSFDNNQAEQRSFSAKKNKNKFKKSLSEPSTPAAGKVKNFESDDDDEEEMSVSDMEDEDMAVSTPSKKAVTNVNSKQKGMKSILSTTGIKSAKLTYSKGQLKKKKEIHGREADIDKGNNKSKKLTKSMVASAESGEDDEDDEEESDEEEEEEGSEENGEDAIQKVANNKAMHGTFEGNESEEDEDEEEDDDEESLEDEDEDEPVEGKKSFANTPGKALPLKSALKTPGTGRSTGKKVSLTTATTVVTPETSSKNKTPLTPHPKKRVDKSKTPTSRRLKFEESEESDEDEEEKSGEGDENDDEDEGENKLIESKEKKIAENEDSEEDEDEEMTDEDEEESDEDEEDDGMVVAESRLIKAKGKEALQEYNSKQGKEAVKKKQVNLVPDEMEVKGVKRKFADGPVLKLENAKEVVDEERKRREERDRKSLFVRGLPKDVKLTQIKALHDDIMYVRHMPHRNFAWLIFASEQHCDKAYEDISKQTVGGKTLTVDFCGAKSKTRPQKQSSELPINPLELFVGGLPPSTSKDQMKVIFRQATNITFPKQAKTKNKLYCFIQFGSEKEARAAFEKGKTLKINGAPVDVLYARIRKDLTNGAKVKPQKLEVDRNGRNAALPKPDSRNKVKKSQIGDEDTSEEIESSEEGINEVDESLPPHSKKAKVTKTDLILPRKSGPLEKKKSPEALKSSLKRKKALSTNLSNGSSMQILTASATGESPADNDSNEDDEDEDDENDDDEEEDEDDSGDDDDMEDSDESN